LSTVEINNDIVALEEEERQEIERILLALSDEARSCSTDLEMTAELISRLDLIQAKARLSEACNGTEPYIDDGKELNLVSARHPLLLGSITERAEMPSPAREAVPISLRVNEARSALVLTGPNTGGKTVALKTAGLLSLMAQTGLHVSADAESSFPVFQRIFADIGDEQSIGSSLSTFSAHLRNIVEMEKNLIEPTLVLLDEVGTGTDPAEGGALGTALVDHFKEQGALVLASTHHGMLKSYATTTPGVGSASFQFDPETYEPIYRLVDGSTGRSLALEMARRLGLPQQIVDRARVLQNEKERKVEDLLRQLEEDGKAMAGDREQLERDRRAFEETVRRHKEVALDIARKREEEKIAFHKQLREEMDRARSEVQMILEQARSRSKESTRFGAAAETVEPKPSLTAVEMDVGKQIEHVESRWAPLTRAESRPPLEVQEGERVTISSLGLTGTVVEILGDEVEVTVRDKKLRISTTDLQTVSSAQPSEPVVSSSHTSVPERKFVPQELNVIGCTVDEALSQADKFLDDAFLSDHRTVRLIHGLGKGRLRNAIREWLVKHPHVTNHQTEQSGAVTVVELKE
jgi:DNA mismatch repair protein MutS2